MSILAEREKMKKKASIINAKSYDELLDIKYGKIGTKCRNEFEKKAQYFVISEMLKAARAAGRGLSSKP